MEEIALLRGGVCGGGRARREDPFERRSIHYEVARASCAAPMQSILGLRQRHRAGPHSQRRSLHSWKRLPSPPSAAGRGKGKAKANAAMSHVFVVFGAGRQGTAAIHDLVVHCDAKYVMVVEPDAGRARRARERLAKILKKEAGKLRFAAARGGCRALQGGRRAELRALSGQRRAHAPRAEGESSLLRPGRQPGDRRRAGAPGARSIRRRSWPIAASRPASRTSWRSTVRASTVATRCTCAAAGCRS